MYYYGYPRPRAPYAFQVVGCLWMLALLLCWWVYGFIVMCALIPVGMFLCAVVGLVRYFR